MRIAILGFILWFLLLPLAVVSFIALPIYIVLCGIGLIDNIRLAENALTAFDQFVSATLFGGSPHITLSAWSWACRTTWWAKVVIAVTEPLEKNHCEAAWKRELPMFAFVNTGVLK